jgi:hypothetical protein
MKSNSMHVIYRPKILPIIISSRNSFLLLVTFPPVHLLVTFPEVYHLMTFAIVHLLVTFPKVYHLVTFLAVDYLVAFLGVYHLVTFPKSLVNNAHRCTWLG